MILLLHSAVLGVLLSGILCTPGKCFTLDPCPGPTECCLITYYLKTTSQFVSWAALEIAMQPTVALNLQYSFLRLPMLVAGITDMYHRNCLRHFFLFPLARFVLEIPRMRFKKNTHQSLTCLRVTGILSKHGFRSYSRFYLSKISPHWSTLELFLLKIQVIITRGQCSRSSEDSKGEVTLMARVCGWLKHSFC